MTRIRSTLARAAAAATFVFLAATGVLVTQASQAGQNPSAIGAAQPADAAVAIGIGVGFGGPRYHYGWRGGSWVRVGFSSYSPGFYPSYGYVGYAPPVYPYAYYAGPAYYPRYHYWHPYYRPYYYRSYYHPVYYGRGYYHGYRRW